MAPVNRYRACRDQGGSISVMVALVLPILILMLVVIININQLFFQKMKLQATVDACALSAAAVQAAGLNEIADLNRDMALEHDKIIRILARGTWYSLAVAQRAKRFFSNGNTGVLDFIYQYQMAANQDFALKADTIAQAVKDRNMPDSILQSRQPVNRLASFTVTSKPAFYRYYTAPSPSPKMPPVPVRRWLDPDNPRFSGGHDGSYTSLAKRIIPLPGIVVIPRELKKLSRVQADYEIVLPAHDYIYSSSIFGSTPMLRARATAKPAGGYISGGIPSYEAVLVN